MPEFAQVGQGQVLGGRPTEPEGIAKAVPRHEFYPGTLGRLGRTVQLVSVGTDLTVQPRSSAGDEIRDFVLPHSGQPGHAEDLALVRTERQIRDRTAAEVTNLEAH